MTFLWMTTPYNDILSVEKFMYLPPLYLSRQRVEYFYMSKVQRQLLHFIYGTQM